jgi:hypothetical protein
MAKDTLNWDDYERGRASPRQDSVGSFSSSVHFEPTERDHLFTHRNDLSESRDLRQQR